MNNAVPPPQVVLLRGIGSPHREKRDGSEVKEKPVEARGGAGGARFFFFFLFVSF